MEQYPLYFTYTNVVRTDAYEAIVVSRGRLIARREDEDWWFIGVEPGAVAERGVIPQEARDRFQNAYHEALLDLASDCPSFDELEQKVGTFFADQNRREDQNWRAARRAIQDGQEIEEPFQSMKRITDRIDCFVTVVLKDQFDQAHSFPNEETLPQPAVA